MADIIDTLIVLLARAASVCTYLWFLFLSLPGVNVLDRLFYGVAEPAQAAVESEPAPGPFRHTFLTTNGVRLHLASLGDERQPLMLFLHGFPENWYSWRHQMEEFSKTYHVVAVDMRGYNTSEKPGRRTDYRVTELVKDVQGIITGLGYQTCVLVAHDWGGAVAWRCAYDIPEHLDKLIIMNSPHTTDFFRAMRSRADQIKCSWYMFALQLPFVPEFVMRKALPRLFVDGMKNPSELSTQDNDYFVRAMSMPGALTGAINWYRNIFTKASAPPRGAKLRTPTLLVWGVDDSAFVIDINHNTASHFAAANLFQFKQIPNASHWVQQDQPALVNQFMRHFLTERRTRPIENQSHS